MSSDKYIQIIIPRSADVSGNLRGTTQLIFCLSIWSFMPSKPKFVEAPYNEGEATILVRRIRRRNEES